MEHSFNTEIAQKYGMKAAVLYSNFQYWIAKNKANHHNFRDGRTWTYNSMRALADLFPYMSVWDVRAALKALIDARILLAANYNVRGYDRTIWYAFEDEKTALRGLPAHLWNPQMDDTKSTNGARKIHTPIPDNKPNKKPDNNKNFSQGKLSKADAQDQAYRLLIRYGVSKRVANAIVYEQLTPPTSVQECIKNGLAKEKYQADFVLAAGYIVETLNKARAEGKVVGPTKKSKELRNHIDRLNRSKNRKPLSEAEFAEKRENLKKMLATPAT